MLSKFKSGGLAFVALLAAAASSVLAQSTTVPDMPAITLPVSGASIVTACVGIGVVVMLLWFGPKVSFGLVKTLVQKLSKLGA